MRSVKLAILVLLGWLFTGHGALVLAQDQATSEQEKVALKKAKKLRKRILRGADFATLAQKHSDDPGSGMMGGDLGFVSSSQLIPEFEEAVVALEPGEISEPMRTPVGYHLIQLTERREGRFSTRHILIKP